MAKKDKFLVGLDIGSTKTCALIAEIDDEQLKFLALGAAESKGLRKGLIVNLDSTVSSIRRAVEEAESVANVPVESALIGVAGGFVRGVNSRGGVTLGQRSRDIERDDVRRAIDAARNITLPEDREVLHVLPHEFLVDAQDGIRDPVGMIGQRLEANVHVVTSSISATQNLVTAANRAGILISDTVLEPLASAESCLTQDERDSGLPARHRRRHDRTHRVRRRSRPPHQRHCRGWRSLQQRSRCRVAHADSRSGTDQAPSWLRDFSALLAEDTAIEIASVGDRPPRMIFARMVTDIIEPRANELLALIRDDLQRAGLDKQIPAGFVLAGGGAKLHGLLDLAENDIPSARAHCRAKGLV